MSAALQLTLFKQRGLREAEVVRERQGVRANHQLLHSSKSVEWFTPARYVEAVRSVLGSIELDPASCALANETVRASRFYSLPDDGLRLSWKADALFCNPPYGRTAGESTAALWANKLRSGYEAGDIGAAILLVNASTSTAWFAPLFAYPVCFPTGRIRFYRPEGESDSPTIGSAFIYFGPEPARFAEQFGRFGPVVQGLLP
jgi:ParB family chromosome partitioning protein